MIKLTLVAKAWTVFSPSLLLKRWKFSGKRAIATKLDPPSTEFHILTFTEHINWFTYRCIGWKRSYHNTVLYHRLVEDQYKIVLVFLDGRSGGNLLTEKLNIIKMKYICRNKSSGKKIRKYAPKIEINGLPQLCWSKSPATHLRIWCREGKKVKMR